PLHEDRDDVKACVRLRSGSEFLPRDYTQNADIHQNVDSGNRRNRNQNCTWNIFLRLLYLTSKEADVVVAPIIVSSYQHCCAESKRKLFRQPEGSDGKTESKGRVEVSNSCVDDP